MLSNTASPGTLNKFRTVLVICQPFRYVAVWGDFGVWSAAGSRPTILSPRRRDELYVFVAQATAHLVHNRSCYK
jgi:hypothetical protein